MISPATRTFVIQRAANRCEYCRLPQAAYEATFHIDHIVASQHRPDDDPKNLALCCPRCNRKKGPNLAGIDALTLSLVPLFNPRKDSWLDHFAWHGLQITGVTPIGRTTISVLDLNSEDRVLLRRFLAAEGILGE